MTKTDHIAELLENNKRIVLFDGVCWLCTGWSKFILRYDKSGVFKLASVQSPVGQDLLQQYRLPTQTFDTMVYIENGRLFTKSDAFIRIIAKLPFPWFLLAVFACVPRPLRDWSYDRIALNRYKLFGKHPSCFIPNTNTSGRFLDVKD